MTSSQRDPKFRDELKKLNEDLLNVIETNHKKSPYYDFTNPILDYVKELSSLKDKFPLKSNPAPAFSFGQLTTQPVATTTTTPFSTTTATTTPFSTPFSFTGSLFGANSNNNTTTSLPVNNSSTQQPDSTQKAGADDTTANDGDEAEGEEDSQPPQPNVDKFEEENVKYEVRTKLYQRVVRTGAASEVKLIGCGTLFVKELDTPKKLHLIVRQDPDLRRVLLNQIITEQVPISLRPKALQILVANSDGQTTCYFAKVRDDNLAKKLFETLSSVKDA